MTKKASLALLIATILVAPVAAAAAEPETESISRVTVWKAKPGMESKLEEGVKKHNEWHRKQNDTWTLSTWRIESGERTGLYLRIAGHRRWEDFDAEEKWAEADDADSQVNIQPYLDSAKASFFESLPDVSRPEEGGTPPKLAEVLFFHLNQGRARDFMLLIKKAHEAIQKVSWPVHYEWYSLENGGEGPLFALVIPHASWTSMKGPELSFGAMLEKALGRDEAQAILTGFDAAVRTERSELARFRPELSYLPARK